MPFKTRRQEQLDKTIGRWQSIPWGFIPVPIYNNIDGEKDVNGLDEAACSYTYFANKYMEKQEGSYKEHVGLVKKLREPLGKAFKLDRQRIDNMTFYECSRYSDTVFSREFEGLPDLYDFTPEEKDGMRQMN